MGNVMPRNRLERVEDILDKKVEKRLDALAKEQKNTDKEIDKVGRNMRIFGFVAGLNIDEWVARFAKRQGLSYISPSWQDDDDTQSKGV